MAGVGLSLLAWVQQNLDTLQRLQGLYADLDTRRTVVTWSRTLNPMLQPEGEARLGTLRLTWKATRLGDTVTQSGYPRGMGLHDLALYDVGLVVFREPSREPLMTEHIVRVGYRRVRDSMPSFLTQ
jgi:hypothetical protein